MCALLMGFILGSCTVRGELSPPAWDRTAPGRPGGAVTAALYARTGAHLTVTDPASRLEVCFADLRGLPYRVSTPPGSGLAPRITGTAGRVRLSLRPTAGDGPDTVTIVLDGTTRWDIRLPAGAGETHLDLSTGHLTRLELGTSGLLDIRLPPPSGTVPITLTGPAGTVRITAPRTTAVRLRLNAGAGTVSTPWHVRARHPAPTVLTSPGWGGASNRYTVQARAAVSTLALS